MACVDVQLTGFALFLSGCALLTVACSGSAAPYTADAEQGSTHALITVERREDAAAVDAPQAQAFASFVRTPPEVDPSVVTRLAGLDLTLPEAGECTLGPPSRDNNATPLSPLRRVELLDAGDVALETPTGHVGLARRAFPAVTDLVAGVVYSTRDRAAGLPPALTYAVSVGGSARLAPLRVSAEAPAPLLGATLGGVPLGAENRLDHAGAELGWAPGGARDLVYVTLTGGDGVRVSTCAFRDAEGRGHVPAEAVPASGTATLSLHRLRSIPFDDRAGAIDAGELRFDFELVARVAIGPGS